MIILSNGTGTGTPKNPYSNPYPEETYMDSIARCNESDHFIANNPPLSIYKDNKPYMEAGEVECEVVWQVEGNKGWYDIHPLKVGTFKPVGKIRQVYNVLPSESESKDIKTQKDVYSQYQIRVEYFGEAGWCASTDLFKGCVAQGDTETQAITALAGLIITNRRLQS